MPNDSPDWAGATDVGPQKAGSVVVAANATSVNVTFTLSAATIGVMLVPRTPYPVDVSSFLVFGGVTGASYGVPTWAHGTNQPPILIPVVGAGEGTINLQMVFSGVFSAVNPTTIMDVWGFGAAGYALVQEGQNENLPVTVTSGSVQIAAQPVSVTVVDTPPVKVDPGGRNVGQGGAPWSVSQSGAWSVGQSGTWTVQQGGAPWTVTETRSGILAAQIKVSGLAINAVSTIIAAVSAKKITVFALRMTINPGSSTAGEYHGTLRGHTSLTVVDDQLAEQGGTLQQMATGGITFPDGITLATNEALELLNDGSPATLNARGVVVYTQA